MTSKVLLALALSALPALVNGTEQAWRFRVFLDDREIGYHDFRVRERDGFQLLETEASFEYKLLFLTLYEYAHKNTEVWNGNCLEEIESFTDANGDPHEISGALTEHGFLLEKSDGQARLPDCIMSFAYWNPAFLEQRDGLRTRRAGDPHPFVEDPSVFVEALEAAEDNIERQILALP